MTQTVGRETTPGRVRALLWRHPEWSLAAKAGLAVGLSWLAVAPLGGVADQYPYYAPLGAVVAMSVTVLGSVRTSARAVAAVAVGAALALATRPLPDVVSLVVAVSVGVLLSRWSGWGGMGSWIPIAGVFVLLIGGRDPWHYVLAYVGLTGLGTAIGTVINIALPQLPVAPATRAEQRLRAELVTRLRELADILEADRAPDPDRWSTYATEFGAGARRLEQLLSEAQQSRRANWRARRWHSLVERRTRQGRALQNIARLLEETATLLAEADNPVHRDDGRASVVRRVVARSLRATAGVLEADPAAGEDDALLSEARDAVASLRRVTLDEVDRPDDERLVGASVATTLERALRAWE